MTLPCPHKFSRKLNKLLPPNTNPYDLNIPDCVIIACVCDLSEDCGIKECAFFNIDEEMEELATKTQAKFYTGEVSREVHDQEMKAIWQRETQKNLYSIYQDKPVCNEPLLSKEKFYYMSENNLLDFTFNDDGTSRISINWQKATQHGWKQLLNHYDNLLKNKDFAED